MAALNDRDSFLSGESPRLTPVSTNYILLSYSSQLFKVGATATTPASIIITAVPIGILYGTPTFTVTSGTATLNISGNVATLLPANMATDSITVQASLTYLGSTYLANIIINKINDIPALSLSTSSVIVNSNQEGSAPALLAATSTATVMLGGQDDSTNWSYAWTFDRGTGTVAGSTTRTVTLTGMTSDTVVLKCTATKAGYTAQTTNFTITKNKQNNTTRTIYIRSDTEPSTPAPSANTPASWSDTVPAGSDTLWASFGMKPAMSTDYTWSLPASTGGANGVVKYLQLSAYAISKSQAAVYTPITITMNSYSKEGSLTPVAYTGVFKVYLNGSDTATYTSASVASYTYTIPENTTSVTIKLFETDGTTEIDSQLVPVVYDGAAGASGIAAVLTNDSHTVPCDVNGTPTSYAGSGTSIYVYEGGTRLTYVTSGPGIGEFTVSRNTSSVTAGTVSGNGTTTYTTGNITSLSYITGSITFTISGYTSSGTSFSLNKIQSFAKALTGATGTGTPGTNGTDGLKTTSGIVYYTVAQSSAPAVPSATSFAFGTGAFTSLTTNWSTTFSNAATSGATYWASRYNVTESSAGSNTGTPTFSTPFQHINFQGLVTFSSGAFSTLNAGTGSTTVTGIHGGNITTGTITVDKITNGTASLTGGAFSLGASTTLNGQTATGIFQSTVSSKWGVCIFNDATAAGAGALGVAARSSSWAGSFYSVVDTSYNSFYSVAALATGTSAGVLKRVNGNDTDIKTHTFVSTDYEGLITYQRYSAGTTIKRTEAALAPNWAGGYARSYSDIAGSTIWSDVHFCPATYAIYAQTRSTRNKIYAGDGFAPFTGIHDGLISNTTTVVPGDIVVDQEILQKLDICNSIVLLNISTSSNQPGVVGVLSSISDTVPIDWKPFNPVPGINNDTSINHNNTINTEEMVLVPNENYYPIPANHSVAYINALGEGQINVCGENGNIEQGDLIVTSSIPGKGMRQDDNIVRSHTVAKARESVEFTSPTEVKQVACIYLCG